MKIFSLLLSAGVILLASSVTQAGIIFEDDFDSGASPLWGNDFGSWTDAGGVYSATVPDNFPSAYSSLPFDVDDFTFEFDVNDVFDGGVWLRSREASGTSIGVEGVLLVTGAGGTSNSGFYWHVVTNGNSYGSIFGSVSGLYTPGDDIQVRVEVVGDTYSAFLNGSTTAATSITTSAFSSGQVALYDFSGQTFDNVSLDAASVPEPSTWALLTLAGIGFGGYQLRRRKRTA